MASYKNKLNPYTGKMQKVLDSTSLSVLTFKASVANIAALPSSGNSTNDARITNDTHNLYVWDGSAWVDQGDIFDLDWSAIENKPSSSVVDIDDAVTKKHEQNTDTGTSSSSFVLDNDESGADSVRIKNNSGVLEARDGTDDNYVNFKAKDVVVTDELSDGTYGTDIQNLLKSGLGYFIHGGGSAIETGIAGWLEVPFDCTIISARLLADQTGSIKVDIWKNTYDNYPPTNTNTITGGEEPEISSGVKDEDTALTSWTTSLSAGDILYFNVDSCTTIEECLISLQVRKR